MSNRSAPISAAMEDYLKAIYELGTAGPATTSAVADAMHVSAASATNMVKKLAALKLVRHTPYHGVDLTPAGTKIALEVVRHHRLIELFLVEALGIPWDKVHAEAHRLEHVLSETLADRIADYLGDPTQDPHGDPIPSKAGVIPAPEGLALADLVPGTHAAIIRVGAQDPEHLRYLYDIGLVPQAGIVVTAREPFDGPLRVRSDRGDEHSVDHALARQIWVKRKTL